MPKTCPAPRFRRLVSFVVSAALCGAGLVALRATPSGAATRAFATRFSTNAQGDIAFVANALLKCDTAVTGCTAALAATSGATAAFNNNSYTMIPVDTDGDSTTTNSSSADLLLPPGATVLFARLYWGAVSSSANRGTVKFKTPGTVYAPLTTTAIDDSGASAYQASIDVTAAVQAGMSGTYTVGNVALSTGGGTHAGWSMVVAYADPAGTMRNLTVFDGFQAVNGTPVTINVAGFLTPPVGPVNTQLGVVAYEGDQGTSGDQLFLNGVAMSDAVNPANNFFNASISDGGSRVATRNPNDPNTLGFDADIINVPNTGNAVLANSATSASIRLTTSGDVYYPGVVTFVTDLYAPKMKVDKTYTDINGGLPRPGDVIEYTMTVSNTGKDPAINTILTDAVPPNTTYVANSLSIVSGANAGAKSDSVGNDQGQFSSNTARFFLGTGATGSAGGQMNENDVTVVKFRVTIDTTAPDNVPIPNTANVAFTALTLGSASVTPSLLVPVVTTNKTDLSITKTDGVSSAVPGNSVTYSVVVSNTGVSNTRADNAVVGDALPSALTNATWSCAASAGSNCDATSGTGSVNATVDLAVGGTATFTINATVAANAVGSIVNTATITPAVGVTDTDGSNNSATDTDTLTPRADLSISKTDSSLTEVPGSSVTYTVVAANLVGPSAVSGALVNDSPPAVSGSIVWSCVATAGSSCATSGTGPLSELTSLAPGGTATFTVTYTIAASTTGSLVNTATIAAPTGVTDSNAVNNAATDTDTLTVQADLSVTKTHTPAAIVPGSPVTYAITVANAGPSNATAATLTDTFPPGFTVASITTTNWSCGVPTTTVTCTDALVVPGTSTITVTGSFGSASTGIVTNSATVASASDPNTANNTGSDTSTLAPSADLSISKSHRPSNPVAGSTMEYILSVQNIGPSAAASAVVTDTLPAGFIPTIASGAGWTCAVGSPTPSSVVCTATTVPVGASAITVSVTIDPSLSGSIDNTGTVRALTPDPSSANNSSTDTATLVKEADLQIAKSHVGSFVVGTTVQWTIVATNRGPSSAVGVGINDIPGPEITGLSWTCVGAGGATCPSGPTAGPIATSVDLPVGSTATFTLSGTFATPVSTVSNTASLVVPSGVTDDNTLNNSSTDTTTATTRAALSISKSNGQSSIVPGTPTTYKVVASNAGPSPAAAKINDAMPADLTGSTWTCLASAGSTCPAGGTGDLVDAAVNLLAGGRATFTITGTVKPGASGSLANTASIGAVLPAVDPDTTDNTSTDTDTLTPLADLAVTKSVSNGTIAGNVVTYTLVVTNDGPSTATAASVTDTLPAGVLAGATFTCVATNAASCNGSGTWSGSQAMTLPPDSSATFVITGAVDPDFVGALTNIATVAPPSGTADKNAQNNSGTVETNVISLVALSATKDDTISTVGAGATTTYSITVSNGGPSTAIGAAIMDVLPAALVNATWTCTATAPNSCTNVSGTGDVATTVRIAPGSSVSLALTATIDPTARGTVTNTVDVQTPTDAKELDQTNNTATDTDTIAPKAALTIAKTSNADPGPVSSGQLVTYTIVVANTGPAATSGVAVNDALPAALVNAAWTCVGTTGGMCAASGLGSIATAVDLPANSAVTFTVVATVNPVSLGSIVNSATATFPIDVLPVAGLATISATDTLAINARTDLSITKSDGVTTVTPGLTTTYTIVVTNAGPAAVKNAPVTDSPPSMFVNNSWSCTASSGGLCAAGGGVSQIATTVSLPPGGTATFLYTGTVDPLAHVTGATKLSNTASATVPSGVGEIDSTNNSSLDEDTYAPVADLVVTKTDSRTSTVPGGTTDYTITVTNKGPSGVADARLVDAMPTSLTSVSWTCAVFGAFNDCSVGSGTTATIDTLLDLAPGATATFTISALIAPQARGVLDNRAAVTLPTGTTDPVTSDNEATDTTDLTAQADLGVVKTHAGTLVPGTDGTWTIVVSNGGPSSVVGAAVTDNLPSALSAASWTCSVPPGALNACAAASGSGSIATAVDLAPGASATFALTARINESTVGTLTNTASVSAPADVTDSSPANNSASDAALLQPTAALRLTKVHVGAIVPGLPVTYKITVGNDGPSAVSGIRVLDPIPSVLTNAVWSCSSGPLAPAGASCRTPSGSGDIDARASLLTGSEVTFTVVADVPTSATGTITNTAQILSPAGVLDPNPLDNSASDSGLAEPKADLRITKTDNLTSVAPGAAVTYVLKVTNDGPSAVPGAMVQDSLPSALTNASWTCSASLGSSCASTTGAGNINAQVSLANGAVATFVVTAIVDPTSRGTLSNTASVTSPSSVTDPDATNNAASDSTNLVPVSDLKVDKRHVGPLVPGSVGRWAITVTNLGPSAVAGALVNDPLPVSLSSAAWTCEVPAGPANACTFPGGTGSIATPVNLAPGASATFVVDATIAADARGTVVNTATASVPSGTSDPSAGNDASTDTGNLAPVADLEIVKTHTGALVPGSPVRYTLAVKNNGPSTVVGARVNDALPLTLTAATWTCTTSAGGACSGPNGTGILSVGLDLPVDGTATIIVDATIDADARGVLTNTATVTAPAGTTDPTAANDRSTDSGPLTPRADLRITKTHAGVLVPGTNVTYTVTVTNAGPSSVFGAAVTDTLPSELTNSSWKCVASGGSSCATSDNGNIVTTVDLAVNGTATFTLVATIDPRAAAGFANTATIGAPPGTTDPTLTNNSATDGGVPQPRADLAITKSHSGALIPGQMVTWSIEVTNNGPSAVVGATVTDNAPSGLSNATWTCSARPVAANACGTSGGSGNVSTTVDLLPGATATVLFGATISSSSVGTLANTAAVSVPPGTTDPDGANNTVIDSGPRTPMADLTIAKSHAPAIVVPGQPVTYTIDVWNNGPSDAPNAVVNDDLISALRNVAWTCVGLGGGSCDGASGAGDIATTVDLPTNSGARFTIRADVAAGFTGSLTNVASIDPPVGVRDPDPASNTASDPGATLPETDLRVTKSHLGSIVPGEDVTYSIVVSNSGPSDASNATVTDVLPAGLDSATATWTCTATAPNSCTSPSGTGDIVGQTADIVVNGSVTFTVIARVDPTYRGTMTNAASVVAAAGTVDLDLANNDGVDTAAVVARADLTVTKAHLGDLVPGRPVTWTIRVRNNGPSVVSAAEINDVLPGAVSGVAWTCSVSPASTPGALAEFGSFTNSCAIGSGVGTVNNSLSLGVGAVATITVNAIIDPGARGAVTNGELINTAEVFLPSGVIDPTAGNNIGLDRGPLLPSVDLAIVKSHVGPLVPGALVRYQIIVTNAGPSTAVAAPVTDTLPSGLGGATWTCVAAGGSCAAATGVNDIETTLTLPPGASATFTVLATIAADARGLLTNIASVTPDPTGGEIDLTTTDQTATDIGALTPRSDLSIEKFHTGELVPGQRSRWTIVVTNAGPSSAVDATVLDTLPPSLSAATWTCSTRKLLGSIGETACGASDGTDSIATTVSLAAGSAATYVLDALIDPSTLGAIVNSASVAPPIGTSDPEGTRNSATDSGTGVPTADLAVVKTHAGAIVPGEPVMYTIVITNNGPSRVTGAAVRDDLPSSLRNGSWSCVASARSSCDSASGVGSIASTVSLDPFGTATYTLVADVSPDAIGPVVNAASATPPAGVRDPQSSNNTGVDGGASVPTADLRITKVHVGEVAAGKPVTYVIVVENAGPSDVVGAGISDIVAPYLLTPSWTCISTVASTCPASGEGSPTLIADIASGGKLTITLTAMVGAEAPSEAVNTARVNVPVGVVDRFPASNEATDRALVFRLAPILVVPILVVPPTTIVGEVTSTGATPPSVDTTLSAPPAQASGASIPSGPFVRPTTAASVPASISSPTGSKTVPTGIDQGQTKSNGVAGVNASRDTLSLTGSNAVDLVLLGFALLAGGVALVGVSRRRRVRR